MVSKRLLAGVVGVMRCDLMWCDVFDVMWGSVV